MIAKDDKKKIYYVKNYYNHFSIFLTPKCSNNTQSLNIPTFFYIKNYLLIEKLIVVLYKEVNLTSL